MTASLLVVALLASNLRFCSGDQNVPSSPSECNPFSQTEVLRCVSSLVDYSAIRVFPSILSGEALCRRFRDYQICAKSISPWCKLSVVGHVDKIYNVLCDSHFRGNASSEAACFAEMEKDSKVRQCHLNATQGLREAVNATEECDTVQTFLTCLTERYWKNCEEAVRMVFNLLNRIIPNCVLEIVEPPPELERPSCNNGVCTCPDGYSFNPQNKFCVDVDECKQEVGLCSQKCKNKYGGYKCICDARYYLLASDNRSCVRRDKSHFWIFFAHGQSIWNISEDGQDFQLQRAGLQKTAMLDIDMKERRLYYADIGANKLERVRMDAAFSQTIQSFEVDGTEGIAIDWVARNLYTVRQRHVYVQFLDGRFRTTLYKDVMKLPRALAVNPFTGYAYVSDWAADAFIARMAMDGSSFEKIVTEGIVWPNGLTIDYYSDHLYWADAFLDTIESSDLKGGHRRTVVSDSGSVPHVFGLTVADDHLFWTDWTYRGILRADKSNGANVTVLAQTALLPYGIKIFHTSMQPNGTNPCLFPEASNCSQLCLIGPPDGNATVVSAHCACADGFNLEDDKKTCSSNCTDAEVLCGGSDSRCISRRYWCDGIYQCRDQSDEKDCPPRICILPGQFQCHDNKKCINPSSVCDNTEHCEDGSDEKYCK